MFLRKSWQRKQIPNGVTSVSVNIIGHGLGPSDLTLTDHVVDATDQTIYTFSNRAFGAADANRLVIVCGVMRGAGTLTISSITIGGVAATVAVEGRNTSNGTTSAFIAYAAVPTGTTGNVVITWSGAGAVFQGISIYRATKYTAAAPTKTNTATRTGAVGTMTLDLTSPDPGFQIGVAASFGGTNRRIGTASAIGSVSAIVVDCQNNATSWTGLTEDVDDIIEAGAAAVMASASAGWRYA